MISPEAHLLEFGGVRILALLDHEACLAVLRESGAPVPRIAPGSNTAIHKFVRSDGAAAVVINQGGIAPMRGDDERPVNGCTILTLDPPRPARGTDWAILLATAYRMLSDSDAASGG